MNNNYRDRNRDRDNRDDDGEDNFRRRRPRPVTDYNSSLITWLSHHKPAWKGISQYEQERPSQSYVVDILPPVARKDAPAEAVPTRHLHTSLGKSKKPVTVVRWMPEGRRLLAGVHNGEFMLWNGMSFNFETVTAMGSSSLRAAEWSNRKDWLVASNDEGVVYYLQPTLNNPHSFKGHDAPVRDIAFAPSDTKFVTASDDNTLKIWDFTSSAEEAVFREHGWDVKACDWHPSKGLVVSGSKDHSVRLWDPRTTRNLTTLHGHKNAVTATVFSRLRDTLLATSGRDGQTRIFDLRMMRDVAILRGHEKGVMCLSWHPIHPSLISTGGDDGSLHTYLLTEPNTPPGISTATISPYSTTDPRSAPAQSIYPAHRIPHAHDSSIWSLDWHPLGHILATGSNDHYTRFWSRSLPGQEGYVKDQFHLGKEGAEALGTYNRESGKKQDREREEMEEEDEREGLEDQGMPGLGIPGLPGLSALPGLGNGATAPSFTGNGIANGPSFPPHPSSLLPIPANFPPQLHNFGRGAVPPPPPQFAGMDPASLSKLLGSVQHSGQAPYNSQGPPIDLSRLPQGFPPPPFPPSLAAGSGFPPPPPPGSFPVAGMPPGLPGLGGVDGIPGLGAGGMNGNGIGNGGGGLDAGRRRRAPLPSQSEGFKQEQMRGNFRVAR